MATIFWAGDSTVQYNGYETYPQTGIGQVFHLFVKPEVMVENHAKNGRSTKSFIDESRVAPIYDKIGEGDFLFVQFGHNDEKTEDPLRYTEPDGEFSVNLEKFANVARNKKAYPVFISPLTRRCFEADGHLGAGIHAPYVEAMRKTAERLKVPMVDLYAMSRALVEEAGTEKTKEWYMHLPAGAYASHPEGLSDNTHLQYAGAVAFGRLIARGLKELGGMYRDLLSDEVLDLLE